MPPELEWQYNQIQTTNRITLDEIARNYTIAGNTYYDNNIATVNITEQLDKYIRRDELIARLDEFANTIYKIISEHSSIDISEEEFINLLRGNLQ